MSATVIDTLRLADRLKAAGFEAPHAEGMARALGDELAERMLTKSDLDESLRPIHATLDRMDARFEAIDGRFEAMDAKFEAKFEAMDSKFNVLVGVMALGFTLLVGLGGYNAVSPHFTQAVAQQTELGREASEPMEVPSSRSLVEG